MNEIAETKSFYGLLASLDLINNKINNNQKLYPFKKKYVVSGIYDIDRLSKKINFKINDMMHIHNDLKLRLNRK